MNNTVLYTAPDPAPDLLLIQAVWNGTPVVEVPPYSDDRLYMYLCMDYETGLDGDELREWHYQWFCWGDHRGVFFGYGFSLDPPPFAPGESYKFGVEVASSYWSNPLHLRLFSMVEDVRLELHVLECWVSKLRDNHEERDWVWAWEDVASQVRDVCLPSLAYPWPEWPNWHDFSVGS